MSQGEAGRCSGARGMGIGVRKKATMSQGEAGRCSGAREMVIESWREGSNAQ